MVCVSPASGTKDKSSGLQGLWTRNGVPDATESLVLSLTLRARRSPFPAGCSQRGGGSLHSTNCYPLARDCTSRPGEQAPPPSARFGTSSARMSFLCDLRMALLRWGWRGAGRGHQTLTPHCRRLRRCPTASRLQKSLLESKRSLLYNWRRSEEFVLDLALTIPARFRIALPEMHQR